MPPTLSKDSSINRVCGDANQTPLMIASIIGSSRVVENLLSQGADPAMTDKDGYTALHHSIINKHLGASNALIEGGADLEAMQRGFGDDGVDGTPLHMAAGKGFHQGVMTLIDGGANIDSQVEGGATPLFFAANEGRLNAVRVLLGADANPLLTAYGSLPLEMAVLNGHQRVVKELVWWYGLDGCCGDGGVLALTAAASHGHAGIAEFLISDVGVVDTDAVALCAATESCSEECVKLLLRNKGDAYVNIDHGSLPESYDEYVYQETPLACTFMLGSFYAPKLARLLLEAGADTTSSIRFPCDSGERRGSSGTFLELAETYSHKFGSHPCVDSDTVAGLEGVTRLLRQVDAVRALSWLWPAETGRAAESGPRKASVPIVRMIRGMEGTVRVRRGGLFPCLLDRFIGKKDGSFVGYLDGAPVGLGGCKSW